MSDPVTPVPMLPDRHLAKRLQAGRLLTTKVRALTMTDAVALIEAGILMTLARPLIRLVPFRTIAAAVSRRRAPSSRDPSAISTIVDRVAWAVDRSAKRVPTRALCFERGLAAHVMLRRRGLDATLVYGVAPGDGAGEVLRAHVWVHVDNVDVAGGGGSSAYAPLVTFPPGRTHTGPLRTRPAHATDHEGGA